MTGAHWIWSLVPIGAALLAAFVALVAKIDSRRHFLLEAIFA